MKKLMIYNMKMGKILLALILVSTLIIYGCANTKLGGRGCTEELKTCPDGTSVGRNPANNCEFYPCPVNLCDTDEDCEKGICNDGRQYKKFECSDGSCVLIDYVQDPCGKVPGRYYVGDEINIGTEKLTIQSISQQGGVVFLHGGLEIFMTGTNNPFKINNNEIYANRFNPAVDPVQRYVDLEISELGLGENEYVLDYRREVDILGRKVTLRDVHTDDLKTIEVRVSKAKEAESKRINKGKTEKILDLKVTNVRSVLRASSVEKYALVVIVEA